MVLVLYPNYIIFVRERSIINRTQAWFESVAKKRNRLPIDGLVGLILCRFRCLIQYSIIVSFLQLKHLFELCFCLGFC